MNVRDMKSAKSYLDIYIAKIAGVPDGFVLPRARLDELDLISNESVKREKRFAFLLLGYAIEKSLGIKMVDVEFSRLASGKWICPVCEFSISHASGYCAVAVSQDRVGVDIEKIALPRSSAFAKRALTGEEFSEYSKLSAEAALRFLVLKWCEKESAFKASGGDIFVPSDTNTANSHSRIIKLSGEEYALAVCSEDISDMRIFKCEI